MLLVTRGARRLLRTRKEFTEVLSTKRSIEAAPLHHQHTASKACIGGLGQRAHHRFIDATALAHLLGVALQEGVV